MTGPDAMSATALSKQVDVPQSTLSTWLRKAGIDTPFAYLSTIDEYAGMTKIKKKATRPNDWKSEEKLKVVMEATALNDEQLGEFLREKGMYQTHLDQWRLKMLDGLQTKGFKNTAKKTKADAKEIKALKKELKRKDKALAETAALLVLKKKVQEIWGDEDNDIPRRNGK